MITVPNEGTLELLEKTLRAALVVDERYSLRLYRNDYTPDLDSRASDFIEATFWGYFAVDLPRGAWSNPLIVSGKATCTWEGESPEWTCRDGLQTIYGYFVLSPATGRVVWAERFDIPREMTTGAKLVVSPVFTGRGEVV